jgi:hypothetical protein
MIGSKQHRSQVQTMLVDTCLKADSKERYDEKNQYKCDPTVVLFACFVKNE